MSDERNDYLANFMPIVYREIGRQIKKIPARRREEFFNVSLGSGWMGLTEAYARFDPSRGSFVSCASCWVRARIQRQWKMEYETGVPLDSETTYAPEPTGANFEELTILRRALADLPPRERQAIELRFFRGLGFAEVGRRLGVSRARAGAIVERALERMRESFWK